MSEINSCTEFISKPNVVDLFWILSAPDYQPAQWEIVNVTSAESRDILPVNVVQMEVVVVLEAAAVSEAEEVVSSLHWDFCFSTYMLQMLGYQLGTFTRHRLNSVFSLPFINMNMGCATKLHMLCYWTVMLGFYKTLRYKYNPWCHGFHKPSIATCKGNSYSHFTVENSSDYMVYSSSIYKLFILGGACYNCGESGHMQRDCPKGGGGGGGGGGNRTCYTCGQPGHFSRECPDRDSGGGRSDGRKCYNCGEGGHISRDCPKGSGGYGGGGGGGRGDTRCYNCNQMGHIAIDCPAKAWTNRMQHWGRLVKLLLHTAPRWRKSTNLRTSARVRGRNEDARLLPMHCPSVKGFWRKSKVNFSLHVLSTVFLINV